MSLPLDKEMVHLAPEHQLRAILLALCDDPTVRERALNHYRALKAADNLTTGLKRKAYNDLFVCVQCDEAFTNEDNTEESCRYHPGELEVDDEGDFWADHDENCHGEIDTDDMREECPDGFRWDCCNKLGGSKGCTGGKHMADPGRSQRGGNVPAGSEMKKDAGSHRPIDPEDVSNDEEDDEEEDE